VIQSVLFFALGFLCAGFLALMVAPAIWNRAVALTRKRIEATVPLTLGEIQADKDRMRAEFAMSTRRLEMSVKAFREKAAAQIVEIGRNREELKRLASERSERNENLSELEARAAELRTELRNKEEQLAHLSDRLAETQQALDERSAETEKLGELYEEASFASSNRQIELVARESELEKMGNDIMALRAQRKDADRRAQQLEVELKAAAEIQKTERKKIADLEKKVERMFATIADREETIERREKELAQFRDRLKGNSAVENDLNAQLGKAMDEKVKLEGRVADLTLQMSTLLSGAKGGDVENAMAKLTSERRRVEEKLAIALRENQKLKSDLSAYERAKSEEWNDERQETALLREQMNDLAAEVLNITALLEGPDSAVRKALATAPSERQDGGPQGRVTSLADRVRALQKAASSPGTAPVGS
jgi:predicted  nucleic acid-binding Zn-ribbon protein